MKIAIGFYGITRSLSYTINSIQKNIVFQAKKEFDTTLFCHFFKQESINNPRTNEVGLLDVNEWKLLNCNKVLIDDIDTLKENELFTQLFKFGNSWEDNGESLKNIIRQLLSLKIVTNQIQKTDEYDVIVFIRPDMLFHDAFPFAVWKKTIKPENIIIPFWSWSGGLNDRFAVCGKDAFSIYGNRIDKALEYCISKNKPLHSERLLMYSLYKSHIQLKTTNISATRIRSNGTHADENFEQVKIAKRLQAFFLCNLLTKFNSIYHN